MTETDYVEPVNYYDLEIECEAVIVRINGQLYSMNLEHYLTCNLAPDLRMVEQDYIDLGAFVLIEDYVEPVLSESQPLST